MASDRVPKEALTPSDDELKFIFDAFDRDDDGLVSLDELVDLLRACGLNPTKTEACKVLMEYDKNLADGALDFEECKALFRKHWTGSAERDLVEAFRHFDQNKNGFIEKNELKSILMNFGDDKMSAEEVDELIKAMVSEADIDMNNKVDYYEFSRVLSNGSWQDIEKKSHHA